MIIKVSSKDRLKKMQPILEKQKKGESRFAYFPVKLKDNSVIWLESYFVNYNIITFEDGTMIPGEKEFANYKEVI